MITPENQAKLEQAAKLVESVIKTFDLDTTPCPHCQRASYNDWQGFRDAETLNSVVMKIRRIARRRHSMEGKQS